MKPIAEALDEIAKMSTATRMDVDDEYVTLVHEKPGGDYVFHDDYLKLKAERDAIIAALKVADEGLSSISKNSCCDQCQEAKKVSTSYQTKIAEILKDIK